MKRVLCVRIALSVLLFDVGDELWLHQVPLLRCYNFTTNFFRIHKMIEQKALVLRIATDCSGIEAPIQALKQLGIPYEHLFSSDIDEKVRISIKANYKPLVLFDNIQNRDLSRFKDVHLYVCGFPCQPFSTAGNQRGFEDTRGTVFFDCYQTIKQLEPKIFILENVKNLKTHDGGRTFTRIQQVLAQLQDYKVIYKVYNTRDYGIPQNRERIFIIGLRNPTKEFEDPQEVTMESIHNYVDDSVTHTEEFPPFCREYIKGKQAVFADIGFIKYYSETRHRTYSPAITANCSNIWVLPKKRRATVKELLRLQGFPTDFKQRITDPQMKKQIGNSMSVNVVKRIIQECIYCSDFRD